MLGGHSTLNTVVLGEGISKYQIPPHFGHHSSMVCRETLAALAELISKSRVPTPPIWIFHFVFGHKNFLETPRLSIHQTWPRPRTPQVRGVYIQRLWFYRFPLALSWWARGSTAVKRPLFNSGAGRNNWLSIHIFDLNRRDPAPGSGFRDRRGEFS
jgi:hypothetical protein